MNENPPSPGLIRVVGPVVATAVVIGVVVGSGIFKKPAQIARELPDLTSIILVWVLGGMLTMWGAIALAEVGVLFPRAGGNYVFLREGFGRLAGFLWGWVEFGIIRAASIAALATVFTESLHDLLKEARGLSPGHALLSFWEMRCLTLLVIGGLALVNIRGVRWGGGLQLFITFIKVGSLLAIAVLPFVLWGTWSEPTDVPPPPTNALTLGGFGSALLGVLWAYHGWIGLAPLGGEIKNPGRNIPLAFILGTGIVAALYISANIAYHLVVPQGEMAQLRDTTVATVFSARLLGSWGAVIASAAIMFSVFGALNGNLLVGPRLLYAMSEDRLAPRILSAVHLRYHTPALAIAAMAGWSMLMVLAASMVETQKPLFDILTDYSMFGAVIFETLGVATIFVFRRTMPDAPRPYRCWGYPAVPLLHMVLPIFVLGNMFVNQTVEAMAGLGFIAVGVAVYYLFAPRATPDPSPAGLR